MKKDSTLIVAVIDRSGSMADRTEDTIKGFDKFIADQAKLPGECKVSLVQFDDVYEFVWSLKDAKDCGSIREFYSARGGTALNDAIARAIVETGKELASRAENDRPSHVIVVIITDGEENSSREYAGAPGKAAIKRMIEEQQSKYNWTFTYLGANVDAFAEAQALGISASAALNYTPSKKGLAGSYSAMSANVTRSRSAGPGGQMQYSQEERASSMAKDEDK